MFRGIIGILLAVVFPAVAQDKPNILVMFGDDVGYWNISHINHGMMGYQTPNIDRIAREGISFTDYYAEQSCTAGRSAFITGQIPVRTGLTRVGMPGAPQGISTEDPTIAALLKEHGYVTAQFGKNHLGDRDEHLPTNHGFDEFFGNLYHLNIEEEPELPDWPTDPAFNERFRPRGVLHSWAMPDGSQKIEDTGPLTRKRMETVDEEFLRETKRFIRDAHGADDPFFVWFAATRMHVWTHLKPESQGKTGIGLYPDGMVEHDGHVGELLDLLDELDIADDTIVIYSTDNGAEVFTWPDGGTIPWRGEKNTTWEGGFRVPCVVRWPGRFPAGRFCNGIVSHLDWTPTLLAAAGDPDVKEKLLTGHTSNGRTYRVHLDGYNMLDYLKAGGQGESPRDEVFYFDAGGQLGAVRHENFKVMFAEQRGHGFNVWKDPVFDLAWPHVFDLRADPFERAHVESIGWAKWSVDRMYPLMAAAMVTQEFLASFLEYPPRQEPGSFSVDAILEQLRTMQESMNQ